MIRIWLFVSCLLALSCSDDSKDGDKNGFQLNEFSKQFKTVTPPYDLSDTALINNKDTNTLVHPTFVALLPDSIKTGIFGKASVRYSPLMMMGNEEQYYVVKASGGKKTAALVYVFDKGGNFGAAFPFLVPDADPATIQISSIDKSYTISRSITKKISEEEIREGKDVYAYSKDAKTFSLIMTDVLDDDLLELINPIDTLSKKHPLAGDYTLGKKSLVSLRDGRNNNELQFFIHVEKEEDCSGELKGTALFTSSKMAVYREGGDPCVMELHFSPSAVTLKEVEGCGAHRGLKCVFDGKFTRKKTAPLPKSEKTSTKATKK